MIINKRHEYLWNESVFSPSERFHKKSEIDKTLRGSG